MPRRRQGVLLELEVGILAVCSETGASGVHGFAIAKTLVDRGDTRSLTATGTLYRALHRLEAAGLIESWWEAPDAAGEGRPPRRCYRITGAGSAALTDARSVITPAPGTLRIHPEAAT
jgi:DNA-binding PadR family transcriptional regulator